MTTRKAAFGPVALPHEVKIGWATYTIHWTKKEWDDHFAEPHNSDLDPDDYAGRTDHIGLRILIRPIEDGMSVKYRRETLTHEILHVADDAGRATKGRLPKKEFDRSEHIVDRLTGPLLTILMSNPGLVAYLTSDND